MSTTGEKQKLLSGKPNANPPDGGWGWAVVFGCFLQHAIGGGILASYGVLYVPMMDTYDIDKVSVSWIGSLRTGIFLGSAPLIVPFTKFLSCRLLTIIGGVICFSSLIACAFLVSFPALLVCLGVFQGIAFSFTYMSSMLIVNYYFDKKRPTALGLALFGGGFGQIFYPPLQEILLREYGLSWTLLINSGIVMNLIVCGLLYFPLPTYNFEKNDGNNLKRRKAIWKNIREGFDFSVFKIPIFVMYFIHNVLLFVGKYVPYTFLPDRAVNEGFTLNSASILVSIIGIANGIGRIVTGILSSHLYKSRPTIYVIFTCVAGISVCLVPLCRKYADFVLFSIGFGFSLVIERLLLTTLLIVVEYIANIIWTSSIKPEMVCTFWTIIPHQLHRVLYRGGFTCLCNVLLLDLFTMDLLAISLGFVTFAQGIGGFIGAPAAAGISEAAGSDDVMYYFGGAIMVFGGVILQFSLLFRSRDKSEQKS